jgi:hypothetical protein
MVEAQCCFLMLGNITMFGYKTTIYNNFVSTWKNSSFEQIQNEIDRNPEIVNLILNIEIVLETDTSVITSRIS